MTGLLLPKPNGPNAHTKLSLPRNGHPCSLLRSGPSQVLLLGISDPRQPHPLVPPIQGVTDQVEESVYDRGVRGPFRECDNKMELSVVSKCRGSPLRAYNLGMACDLFRVGGENENQKEWTNFRCVGHTKDRVNNFLS